MLANVNRIKMTRPTIKASKYLSLMTVFAHRCGVCRVLYKANSTIAIMAKCHRVGTHTPIGNWRCGGDKCKRPNDPIGLMGQNERERRAVLDLIGPLLSDKEPIVLVPLAPIVFAIAFSECTLMHCGMPFARHSGNTSNGQRMQI